MKGEVTEEEEEEEGKETGIHSFVRFVLLFASSTTRSHHKSLTEESCHGICDSCSLRQTLIYTAGLREARLLFLKHLQSKLHGL